MMKKFFKSQKGFTVLESIVAISILSLSISGVFAAVQQGLSQNIMAKNQIIAFYLAQEGAEILRNRRDSNQIFIVDTLDVYSRHWLSGIAENVNDPCYFDKVCRADAINLSLTSCGTKTSGANCPNLKQDSSSRYGYASGNDTVFRREIRLEQINQNEIEVRVDVFWTKGIFQRQFTAKTYLFNWVRPI